jgi:hypothetical protein
MTGMGGGVDDPFGDERLQFFLRHRDDIREWAAIEKEVVSATRDILAGLQTDIDDQLAAIDPNVTTVRRDNGGYERIMVRRPSWPDWVGVTLEWEVGVDPFGSRLPKFGIFVTTTPDLNAAYSRILALSQATPAFAAGGFKMPEGRAWPMVKRIPKSKSWWQELDVWTTSITNGMIDLWPKAAAVIHDGLIEG